MNCLNPKVISVVDDDESIRAATRGLLRSFGYQVETFASAESFLESGAERGTGCLILDVRMPGMGGLELQQQLKAAESQVPIIFVSAHEDGQARLTALAAGAIDFFRKPFEAGALLAAIEASQSH